MHEIDLQLPDGRTLHAYDNRTDGSATSLTVLWHHGTPNVGEPPAPLFPASERLGIRWIGYDRPGYGGSTRRVGRDVASAAADAAAVADALGVERFAVMSHSGGGPHALASAALLAERVIAAICGSSLAPYGADGLDWFAGMAPGGAGALRAALAGREAKETYEAVERPDEEIGFVEADFEALSGAWSWFGPIVRAGLEHGTGGMVDDDLAYVAPWGFAPADVTMPTLLLHGERDRMVPSAHSEWLAARLPSAELWLEPGEGHVSVLRRAEDALQWLADRNKSPA
jgi:pimeloyl-ACP methyl ester carboxylesterase